MKRLLAQFPAVCLLGPRQCGKTTFVRKRFPNWKYFDMEKPSHRAQIESDPEAVLARHKKRIVFDEAQEMPEIFPVLRGFIDEDRASRGRILLLGSASPRLTRNISETLAGRVGFLDMSPLHVLEVDDQAGLWLKGGFPDAYLAKSDAQRADWFEAYTRTFIERDLRLYGVDVDAALMRRLWTMLSHLHGGLLNASGLGNSLGASYHTVNRYIDILEETFLVRRLRPYFANIGKRLVKSPKIFVRDTGLLHYFLNCAGQEELLNHPKRGSSWEGFVIEQLIAWAGVEFPGSEHHFWQTSTGHEVDLLLKIKGRIIPIEIKLHTAPTGSDVKGLFRCMEDLGLKRGFVVRPEGESYSLGRGVEVVSLATLIDLIGK